MPYINQNMNRRAKQSLINILLNREYRLNPESNRELFEYVQVFIETTGRMSRSYVSLYIHTVLCIFILHYVYSYCTG